MPSSKKHMPKVPAFVFQENWPLPCRVDLSIDQIDQLQRLPTFHRNHVFTNYQVGHRSHTSETVCAGSSIYLTLSCLSVQLPIAQHWRCYQKCWWGPQERHHRAHARCSIDRAKSCWPSPRHWNYWTTGCRGKPGNPLLHSRSQCSWR